jgi:hypothetical protein
MDALAQLPRITTYQNSFAALHELAKVIDSLPAELVQGSEAQPDRFVFLRAPEVKLTVIRIYRNMGQSGAMAEKAAKVLLSGTIAAARKFPKSYSAPISTAEEESEESAPLPPPFPDQP